MLYLCRRGQSGLQRAVFAFFPSVRRESIKKTLNLRFFAKKQVNFWVVYLLRCKLLIINKNTMMHREKPVMPIRKTANGASREKSRSKNTNLWQLIYTMLPSRSTARRSIIIGWWKRTENGAPFQPTQANRSTNRRRSSPAISGFRFKITSGYILLVVASTKTNPISVSETTNAAWSM